MRPTALFAPLRSRTKITLLALDLRLHEECGPHDKQIHHQGGHYAASFHGSHVCRRSPLRSKWNTDREYRKGLKLASGHETEV